MKRYLAILLIFATLLITLAACVDAPDAGGEGDTVAAENETQQLDNIPEDLKFNGEDVVILSRSLQGWTQDEVAVPELNSDPVNDAVFNRNITVGDRLGVNIVSSPIEDPNQFLPIEEIERAVKAGSDEFDMVAMENK